MTDLAPHTRPDTDSRYHYALMRRAIDLIDAQADSPQSLDDLARQMNPC